MNSKVAAVVLAAMMLAGPDEGVAQDAGGDNAPPRFIDISVQYSIRLPMKADDADSQREAMEAGRKMLYEMSGSECKLMLETISSVCRLERLNVQGNFLRQRGDESAVTLQASAQYKVGLKASP